MNPYQRAADMLPKLSLEGAFQVVQYVNDCEKLNVPYSGWFDDDDLILIGTQAGAYTERALTRKETREAMEMLRLRSVAFQLCDPTPEANFHFDQNSITWTAADGIDYERLI